jgi:hypothetical protein
MSAASNYTENNVLNAMLRGVTFPLPAGTYVSLHTGDPGETGANEVSTIAWPAYVRKHAEDGGAIGTGWSASTTGSSSNANQLPFVANNGAGPITITHFGVWDAASGGNYLTGAACTTPRTLEVLDVLVFSPGTLTITQA